MYLLRSSLEGLISSLAEKNYVLLLKQWYNLRTEDHA